MSQSGQRSQIVVVGGGHAGVAIIQALADVAEVKLVDKKDYLELNWATVRAPVEPQISQLSLVSYQDIPKVNAPGTFIRATATQVTPNGVRLSTGQLLPYDYLVLAFGTDYRDKLVWNTNGSLQERRKEFQEAYEQLKQADSIILVGGGPVGVEMAAEVATAMPGKAVTLVTSQARLLADQPVGMSRKALRSLKAQGVQVILGEKLEAAPGEPGAYKLAGSGTVLRADVVRWCVGQQASSGWLKAQHPDILDERGFIKVDQFLRVEGHPNWFALGDCASLPDGKLGYQAKHQSGEVVANIKALIQKGPGNANLSAHKPARWIMAVTLGKNDAAMHVSGWGMPACLPVRVKSRDMLVGMTRRDLGLAAT